MKTKIELFGYKENNFLQHSSLEEERGWGNGYVLIPKGHPFLIRLELEDYDYMNYLSHKDFEQEITLSRWDKDKEYYKIGFDTNHLYNKSHHDKDYVMKATKQIQSVVDNYTLYNALSDISDEKERAIKKYDDLIAKVKNNYKL